MTISGRQLQRNQLIDLTVTGLAFGGKGIARVDDFVVFVSGAVPGDVVRARVTKNKKRYAEARAEELLTASPDRRPARCPSFGSCGGCVWQNLDYGVQLRYKSDQVRESLEHLGGLRDFELLPIVGMADPWRYRNRADFSVGMTGEGAIVGFRPPGRWDSVLPLSECHLLAPVIEGARGTVEAWLRENGLPGWDPRTGAGHVRHLLVRSAQGGTEVLVSLVTTPKDLPDSRRLVECLRAAHPEMVGIVHAVNGGRAEISSGLESETLWGRSFLLEKVAGITIKVSVDAFFQTNTLMAHALYGIVAREVGAGDTVSAPRSGGSAPGGPVIWDLYSGVGSIGLSLAAWARAVLAIEAVPAAVADARENARLNGIDNVHFLEGDVAKVLREVADGARELPEDLEQPDVIVVDPPRAGLAKKAVARIGEVGTPRIVYVSCNPSTMAPDIAQFGEYGYRLEHVTPVDMFPHTPHVEAVGLLVRVDGKGSGLEPRG
ncbi:MAG: 23S rRNA (uracil(1939)-C(5))-methyltransferase RlmD [Thermoleophilia bacterium]|nr:23S rRNA (uracil(1939)-C(5))-methyltransferase RlmD [Thermoleophilia bacterium]